MDTLTVHQPWASMIALGIKTIETREHDSFKGVKGRALAIHAGKKIDYDAFAIARESIREGGTIEQIYILRNLEIDAAFLPFGRVLCVVRVTEARWLTEDDKVKAMCETDGRFGLFLEEVKRIDNPPEARGRQGVWQWGPRVKYEFES